MQSCLVAFGRLVVTGGNASPVLDLVDAPLYRVPVLIECHVVADRPPSARSPLLAVCGLVHLLRDHGLDTTFAQVSAVLARRVGLVRGNRVGPGARTADRNADLDPAKDRLELRAVARLSGGQYEGERAAAPVRRQVDLAGQPALGPSEGGCRGPDLAAPSRAASAVALLFARRTPRVGPTRTVLTTL